MQASYPQSPNFMSLRPSPRSPPMSKFFQPPMPAPGRNSPRVHQNPTGSDGPVNSVESSPPLPQRSLPGSFPPNSTTPGDGRQLWNPSTLLQGTSASTQLGGGSYNPQSYGPMPSAQNSPRAVPRHQGANPVTKSDTSKWGVKYNNHYPENQNRVSKPPLPPRPSSGNYAVFKASQRTAENQSQDELDGYKLQPVTYDPNAETDDSEDPRQSWQEGDDLESIQPGPSTQPPPKPPKIPRDYRFENVQKTQVAPQLPPLFFETGSQTQQQDFAYTQPEKPQVPPTGTLLSQQSQYPAPNIPRAGENHLPPFGLSPPPPRPPSRLLSESRQEFNKKFGQATAPTKAAAYQDERSWQQNQSLPPPPPLAPPKVTSNPLYGPDQTPKEYLNSGLQTSSSKPHGKSKDQPNIGNLQGAQETLMDNQTENIMLPEQMNGPSQESKDDQPETNGSFYWHSPQSSADTTLSRSPAIPAIDEAGDFSLSKKTTNTTGPDSGLYSASALGFGGPSDWEHFGDYDAEVIDDTDLYITAKPKKEMPPLQKAIELSTITSPVQAPDGPLVTLKVDSVVHEPSTLLDIQIPKECPSLDIIDPRQLAAETLQEVKSTPESEPGTVLHVSQERENPTTSTKSSTSTPDPPNKVVDTEDSNDMCENQIVVDKVEPELNEPDQHLEHSQLQALDLPSEIVPIQTPPTDDEEESSTDSEGKHSQENDNGDEVEANESRTEPSFTQPEGQIDTNETSRDFIEDLQWEKDTKADGNRNADESAVHPLIVLEKQDPMLDIEDDGGEDIIVSLKFPASSQDPITSSLIPEDQKMHDMDEALLVYSCQPESPMRESPEIGLLSRRSMFPKSIELDDPYANLDPWAKASLNRYVKMLREESQAEKDEDKYMVFMAFTRRESRLRAVLYDVDDEPEPLEQVVKRAPLKESTSILTLRPSIRSKALPALPPGANRKRDSKAQISPPQPKEKPRREPGKLSEGEADLNTNANSKSSQEQSSVQKASSDESYVMIDPSASEQYTLGGRPMTDRQEEKATPLKITPSLTSLRRALDMVANQANAAFGKDARLPIKDAFNVGQEKLDSDVPRSNSVPPLSTVGTGKEVVPPPISDRPAYVPARYNEGHPYEGDKATNRQTIYRPFSMSLRPGSIRSQTTNEELSRDSFEGASNPQSENDEKGLNEKAKINSESIGDSKKLKQQKPIEIPAEILDQRNSILGPLFIVIPPTNILHPQPRQILSLKQTIDAIPDEFGFIHESVLAWDADAKEKRAKHESDRHIRQGESEQRIDALFNENQIGYGDIPELEAEFKRSEAAKKADEDRAEFQSFVAQVFDGVWARLHYEMDQLTPCYETCVCYVKDASAGRDMFENPDDRVPIAPAMENLLILYQKLSIRHQKAFEAVLERDRRLKKTEIAPWYALGNIKQVKKIERRFEDAEKKAILDFCSRRDGRANALMDVLDEHTLRGVGKNQDYMESVMQAVRKIASDVAYGKVLDDTSIPTDEVLKAKSVTAALARSSETIVQTFHVADMLLNAADYEVSAANARISNAKPEDFKKLKEAKVKEDQKLVKDLEHRLGLIRGDTARTLEEIAKLLMLVGTRAVGEGEDEDEGGGAPVRSSSAPVDPEREARLLAALEEAKRRNLLKETGG